VPDLPMDLYRRVSRRNGRDGDTYHSPSVQLEAGEAWARLNAVTIGKVPPPEEDVSGAVEVANRDLERLLERVEAGVSAGIIVYKSDRFARNTIETLVAAKRIKDAGGRLVGVRDGVDSATPGGQTMLALMATMAEQHLDNIKDGWKATTGRAVANGVHIACRAPVGYKRRDVMEPAYDARGKLIRDGRLVLDPEAAPVVKRAFQMKAEGASLLEIRAYWTEAMGRSIAKSSLSQLFKNRVYLGEARGPHKAVLKGAHDPVVTEREFAEAASKRQKAWPRNGTLSAEVILTGLVVCDACDHALGVIASKRKSGERVPTYACVGGHVDDCPAPGAMQARRLDDLVRLLIAENHDLIADAAASVEQRAMEARAEMAAAEAALDQWVDDAKIAKSLGPDRFQRGLIARQDALDEAKRALWDLDYDETPAAAEPTVVAGVTLPEGGGDDWDVVVGPDGPMVFPRLGKSIAGDRRIVRRYVAEVRLARADPKRRASQPPAERVTVKWVGQDAAAPAEALTAA
jgi:DNA invertase Pin-like site-specific DNA recombinase